MTACGRSPIRRCPQSAIVRIGACSRRAYSNPSLSGTQLSCVPQRQRHGQCTRSSSVRGSVATSARPAVTVSVCCRGPSRNHSAISGSKPAGSATPHQPKVSVRPSASARTSAARRPIVRPGFNAPSTATVASPTRVADEMPALAARTMPVTASGRRTAARSATTPPSEWPTERGGQGVLGLGDSSTASANGSTSAAPRRGAPSRRGPVARGRSRAARPRGPGPRAASSRPSRQGRGRARAAGPPPPRSSGPAPRSARSWKAFQISFGLRRHLGIFFR